VATNKGAFEESCWNLLQQLNDQADSPSRMIRREEAVGALLACMSSLQETHRQVIQWRFMQGLSVAKVASRLEKSEDAVVALNKRALAALRKAMDQMGEFTQIR